MRFIEVGQRIRVELKDNEGVFFDSIIEVVDSDRICLSLNDVPKDLLNSFEEGDEIFCSLMTQFGIRLFNSMIIEFQDNYLEIDYNPSDYELFQRRQWRSMN